jgi:5-methylcytosine-specific restriction endonuclease McrA
MRTSTVPDSGFDPIWIRRNYKEYLQSAHWQNLRRRFFKSGLNKGACARCRTRDRLHLHHKTYKNVGREHLADLCLLCEACHSLVHQLYEEHKGERRWTLNRTTKRLIREERKKRKKERGMRTRI